MRFIPLIWAGMWRKPARAILTLLSIVNAFLLFAVLQGFVSSLSTSVADAHANVLITTSRVSQIEPLPLSMAAKIRTIDGVQAVAPVIIFHGSYRSMGLNVRAYAVDPDALVAANPQEQFPPSVISALKQTRDGVVAPAVIASAFGWRVGDQLPIRSLFWTNRDGSPVWHLRLVGVYSTNPEDLFFAPALLTNFDYVDQARSAYSGTASLYLVRVSDPRRASEVARAIDRLFANSPNETRTTNERQVALDAVNQISDLGLVVDAIAGATFFALLISVGVVMLQSMRERRVEIGVMKALGFTRLRILTLMLCETLVFCLGAAAIGIGLALVVLPLARSLTGFEVKAGRLMAVGLAFAIGLALVTGFPPAWRSSGLRAVDALRGG